MRYWLDTEFYEDGKRIYPISIGIVAEDDRTFYAEWPKSRMLCQQSPWLTRNVLPKLSEDAVSNAVNIRADIITFVNPVVYGAPEFWGYYADYDWIVLCQLFGTMMQLPHNWPKFCMDVKQLAVSLGDPTLPPQDNGEHNALADAWDCRRKWEFLQTIKT